MKILAVGAHLDDIEIACGGTLAKARKAGHEVKAVVMSKSSYTNSDGELQRSEEVAVSEGTEALNLLGVYDIVILDFPTKDVSFKSEEVDSLDKIIEEYNPDIIFTHYPFDTHQAHEGTSKATVAAARRRNTIFFYEPFYPSGRSYVPFKPQMYVDISEVLDQKLMSLRAHESEYNKFGEEEWINGVVGRARYRGSDIGSQYAEAFEVLREELSFNEWFHLV